MIAGSTLLARLTDGVPPLTPDGDEARRWAEDELAKPAYEVAKPTPLDMIARAIGDFFAGLFRTQLSDGWGAWAALIAVVVVIVIVVAALLVWGRPRPVGRSRAPIADLFGESDARSADELRSDATSAARRSAWDDAIVLRFRALARGLVERGIVEIPPGATVHRFARTAAHRIPSLADELEAAATAFDDVRYLRRPGTEELYRRVAGIDEAAMRARAIATELLGVGG
ncbi:MAG: DUF4129 domain-containing protein [Actinobacteria bacterium]|nr:DUF4129 domain-containing protein [Actinomycetota bacterium]